MDLSRANIIDHFCHADIIFTLFVLIVESGQRSADSNHLWSFAEKMNNYWRFFRYDFRTKLAVRSAQLLYIVPCRGGPVITAKDLMKGDRNMKAIREYLKHKPCLRGQILDRGELKRVAQACGLSPQQARLELRELGFILTRNDHGLTIWKKLENDS
jgi:hypothetical protein